MATERSLNITIKDITLYEKTDKNIFEKFGFEIRRKPNEEEIKYLTFDEIYKKKFKYDPNNL